MASLFPRDAPLHLPARDYSHRLQKRVVAQAVKMAWAEVSHDIEPEPSGRIGKAQVEQLVYAAARDCDAFYAQPGSEAARQHAQAKPIQVVTFDGKGVVMRHAALRDVTRKKAEAHAQQPPRGCAHKEKATRKPMAAVAGIYHIDRHIRCAQTVARQCAPLRLVPTSRLPAPKPVGKKLWARLAKSMGYHLEHNFGHGKQYLSATLLSLNVLAFLFHTVLEWGDEKYALIRQVLARRQTFFEDIRALTRYMVFESWHHLMDFMIRGLELESKLEAKLTPELIPKLDTS